MTALFTLPLPARGAAGRAVGGDRRRPVVALAPLLAFMSGASTPTRCCSRSRPPIFYCLARAFRAGLTQRPARRARVCSWRSASSRSSTSSASRPACSSACSCWRCAERARAAGTLLRCRCARWRIGDRLARALLYVRHQRALGSADVRARLGASGSAARDRCSHEVSYIVAALPAAPAGHDRLLPRADDGQGRLVRPLRRALWLVGHDLSRPGSTTSR